ncbi:MAG: biotin--[acetyl-CoA-carboxylase] ligase [Thermoplasmatota archaeon]
MTGAGSGWRIVSFAAIDSTNRKAREMAEAGEPEGAVVVAGAQTEGRGRLGRSWISPVGGLWFSVLLRPDVAPEHAPKLGLIAGASVAAALRGLYSLNARLRWPNDVLVGGRKLCGILMELAASGERVEHIVLGIGVNASFPLEELPPELRRSSTTLQQLLGHPVDLQPLLSRVLDELASRYLAFKEGAFESALSEWRELSETLGRRVRVRTHSGVVEGRAEGIESDGSLRVVTGDGPVKVSAGDCVHLE